MSKPKLYVTATGVWFVFLAVAFLFGTLRELALTPLVGEHAAHVVGTLAVVAAFLGTMAIFIRRIRSRCTSGDFWRIGLLWFVMTAGLEFLFFHTSAAGRGRTCWLTTTWRRAASGFSCV